MKFFVLILSVTKDHTLDYPTNSLCNISSLFTWSLYGKTDDTYYPVAKIWQAVSRELVLVKCGKIPFLTKSKPLSEIKSQRIEWTCFANDFMNLTLHIFLGNLTSSIPMVEFTAVVPANMPPNSPLYRLEPSQAQVPHLGCLPYNITVIKEPSLIISRFNSTERPHRFSFIEFNETTKQFILNNLPPNNSLYGKTHELKLKMTNWQWR